MVKARPLGEWHEDIGPVLWWKFPLAEAPYVGSPLDCGQTVEIETRHYGALGLGEEAPPGLNVGVKFSKMRIMVGGWPGYHTHWTPLPDPPEEPE